MKSLLRSLVLSALAIAGLSSAASAMSMDEMGSSRIVSFGLGGGVTVPVADAKNAFKTGFNGQGFVRFNLRFLPIQPRLDFTFSKFNLNDAKLAGTTGTGQLLAGVANLQMYLIPGGPIRPYIVAGVGAYQVKTIVDNTPNGETSDTKLGVNGGGGLVIKLGHLLSAYAEGRVDNVFTDKGLISKDKIQVVPVAFGIVF